MAIGHRTVQPQLECARAFISSSQYVLMPLDVVPCFSFQNSPVQFHPLPSLAPVIGSLSLFYSLSTLLGYSQFASSAIAAQIDTVHTRSSVKICLLSRPKERCVREIRVHDSTSAVALCSFIQPIVGKALEDLKCVQKCLIVAKQSHNADPVATEPRGSPNTTLTKFASSKDVSSPVFT